MEHDADLPRLVEVEAMPGDVWSKMLASSDLTYALLAAGEEVCEMLGTAVFLYALLAYLAAGRLAAVLRFG